MRKIVIIILALVVALSALPVTFACYKGGWGHWDRFWRPHTIVYANSTDCGIIFTYQYAYDNDETSSWEPKDVAQTAAEITNCDKNLVVTITNAYPGYEGTIEFCIKNTGIYPATVTGITTDYPDPDFLQIDLTGDVQEGVTLQAGETKCGQLVINGIPQRADAQNRNFEFTITIDFECLYVPKDCETAFAYKRGDATCFSVYDFTRWGWTNGPLRPGYYSFGIYAGAGGCNPYDGKKVGWLTVRYNGSTAIVTYNMYRGYKMDETHLYVGSDPLPSKNGGYTVSPGQYPYKHDLDNARTDRYVVEGLPDEIYIVAHAVVCD